MVAHSEKKGKRKLHFRRSFPGKKENLRFFVNNPDFESMVADCSRRS